MRAVMDEKCSQHNCSRPMSQSVNLVDWPFSELTFNNLSFNELTHFQQRQRSKKKREYRKIGNELRVLWGDGDFQLTVENTGVVVRDQFKSGNLGQEFSALNILHYAPSESMSCGFSLIMNFKQNIISVNTEFSPNPAHSVLYPLAMQNHLIIITQGNVDVQTKAKPKTNEQLFLVFLRPMSLQHHLFSEFG